MLGEAGLAATVGHGLVLQGALAALVADRAVQRVVDEQQLHHPVLGLLGDGAASPIFSSLKYFREEYEQHITGEGCPFDPARSTVWADEKDDKNAHRGVNA